MAQKTSDSANRPFVVCWNKDDVDSRVSVIVPFALDTDSALRLAKAYLKSQKLSGHIKGKKATVEPMQMTPISVFFKDDVDAIVTDQLAAHGIEIEECAEG